jgi:hypothetical protein
MYNLQLFGGAMSLDVDKKISPGVHTTAFKINPRSKREQIVRAALKVFLEKGYAATSMNRVADEADVIKATIYSHFKDKEQLFVAIIEEATIAKFFPLKILWTKYPISFIPLSKIRSTIAFFAW